MFAVLVIVLPIFALIFAGWSFRRIGVLGPHASTELNRFVVYLALPALLFDIIANAHWNEIWQPSFVGAFGLGALIVFVFIIVLRMRGGRHLADAAIDGLNGSYANTGFIGFPLAAAVLGRVALAPTLIATIITVCLLFAFALILIEVGLQTEKHPRRMILKVGQSLVRNPLLVAPTAGAVVLALGVSVPVPAESFLKLLGGAASPCALVALGLFLAEKRERSNDELGVSTFLVACKLLAQPLLTWLLAARIFHTSALLTHTAVLLAALPTGTGPFMVAEFYRREARITSAVVLASTVVSLVTITLCLSIWN